jgi:hypothetical protein
MMDALDDNKMVLVFDMLIERLTNLEQKNDLLHKKIANIKKFNRFFPDQTTIQWMKYFDRIRFHCFRPVMDLPVHIQNIVFAIINPCDNTEITVVVRDNSTITFESQKEFADTLLDVLPKPFLVVDRPIFTWKDEKNTEFISYLKTWESVLSNFKNKTIIGTMVWEKSMMKGAEKLKDDIQYSPVQLVEGEKIPHVLIWEIIENHRKASRFVLEKKCEGVDARLCRQKDIPKWQEYAWIKLNAIESI